MKTLLSIFLALISTSSYVIASDLKYKKPSADMIKEAKKHPNGWLYAIEGSFKPDEKVPPDAITGAWKVDKDGNIIEGSFVENPNFKNQ